MPIPLETLNREPELNLQSIFSDDTSNSGTLNMHTPSTPSSIPTNLSSPSKLNIQPVSNSQSKKDQKTLSQAQQPSKKQPVGQNSRFKGFQRKNVKRIGWGFKPKKASIQKKYTVFDNEGKGNCQLFSILKGLEMQHSDLLKYTEKGQSVELTAQKLRQIGVDFARNQIDTCGNYADTILGYLDSDRKEHNNWEMGIIKRKMYQAFLIIEKDFKTGKITKNEYENHKSAYQQKCQDLEKNVGIQTDADFLKHLETDGSYCSTLHLFALSAVFKVPIFVKEQAGVKNHDVQKFNPAESNRAPIYLYRVANMHYKYILHTKQ